MSRDDDQAWADLVETFHASPGEELPRWPAAEDVADDAAADVEDDVAAAGERSAQPEPASPRPDPEEHFVPPPPPPLPRGDRVSRLAWAGVLGAPVFLVLAVALGWRLPTWITVLAVGALVGGFVTLVARMRGRDPYDPDDGAVV
ncbi:MAG: hypothetical protein ACRDVN_05765 [Jiangellaceae bacterium]